jgi:hypothetical protein
MTIPLFENFDFRERNRFTLEDFKMILDIEYIKARLEPYDNDRVLKNHIYTHSSINKFEYYGRQRPNIEILIENLREGRIDDFPGMSYEGFVNLLKKYSVDINRTTDAFKFLNKFLSAIIEAEILQIIDPTEFLPSNLDGVEIGSDYVSFFIGSGSLTIRSAKGTAYNYAVSFEGAQSFFTDITPEFFKQHKEHFDAWTEYTGYSVPNLMARLLNEIDKKTDITDYIRQFNDRILVKILDQMADKRSFSFTLRYFPEKVGPYNIVHMNSWGVVFNEGKYVGAYRGSRTVTDTVTNEGARKIIELGPGGMSYLGRFLRELSIEVLYELIKKYEDFKEFVFDQYGRRMFAIHLDSLIHGDGSYLEERLIDRKHLMIYDTCDNKDVFYHEKMKEIKKNFRFGAEFDSISQGFTGFQFNDTNFDMFVGNVHDKHGLGPAIVVAHAKAGDQWTKGVNDINKGHVISLEERKLLIAKLKAR